MKVVQSFWSSGRDLRKIGFGWHSSQYHIMSWALSALQLRKYYDNVELYTDSNGYKILIEYLKLPYTSTHICYDKLHQYEFTLWAVPKIKTYAAQQGPFIHVDGDVFIWKPFSKRFNNAPLIAQNYETGTDYYKEMCNTLQKDITILPPFLEKELSKQSINSVNAGILGGCDINFYQSYTAQALELVKTNKNVKSLNFNLLFEQILFCCMAGMKKKKIQCHFRKRIKDNGYAREMIADLLTLSFKGKFAHLLGPHKRNPEVCEIVGRILLKEYPEYFLKIVYLFRQQHHRFNSHIKQLFKTNIRNSKCKSDDAVHPFESEWNKLPASTLYDMDLKYGMPTPFFTATKSKQIHYKISRHPEIRISEKTSVIACIPELFFNGYKELEIDDLEYNILALLDEDITVMQMIASLKPCFPETEENDAVILDLTVIKLKRLLQSKLIRIYKC